MAAGRTRGQRRPARGPGVAKLALALAGLAGGLAACSEPAQQALAEPAGEGGAGRILYLTYCQGCHGVGGRGDGLAAPSLRTPPPDLTRLWQRYGTPLDRERLARYIDGRRLIEPHRPDGPVSPGEPEMPVWGREFFADAPPVTPGLVEGQKRHLIDVLVAYLETLQGERRL